MTQVRSILLIEDQDDLREALSDQLLVTQEFMVEQAANGQEALDHIAQKSFDLIILDVNLPDTNGLELCKIMRNKKVKCPIVVLTGHDEEENTVLGLDSAVNDYVTKPFKMAVLLARLRAQLRQHALSEDISFKLGPYTFQPAHKVLTAADGQKVRLTEKETKILKFLLRAGAVIVPREKLLHEVWGYNAAVTTHTLETHIYRLRQKIEVDPSNASLLVTAAGGYKLVV